MAKGVGNQTLQRFLDNTMKCASLKFGWHPDLIIIYGWTMSLDKIICLKNPLPFCIRFTYYCNKMFLTLKAWSPAERVVIKAFLTHGLPFNSWWVTNLTNGFLWDVRNYPSAINLSFTFVCLFFVFFESSKCYRWNSKSVRRKSMLLGEKPFLPK